MICSEISATRSSGPTVRGSLSISASQGDASVIIRAVTYASSGETTTVVPRSRATARISSDGGTEFGVTRSDTPSSIARRCASSRSPTTITSPAPIGAGDEPIAMVLTQIRPSTSWSSPATISPSRTWTTAATVVAASPRLEASRDSRMYLRARARMVMTPASTPSSPTIGTRSRLSLAIASPTSRTGSRRCETVKVSRITSLARSITWGRNSGSGAPLRSSTQRV